MIVMRDVRVSTESKERMEWHLASYRGSGLIETGGRDVRDGVTAANAHVNVVSRSMI